MKWKAKHRQGCTKWTWWFVLNTQRLVCGGEGLRRTRFMVVRGVVFFLYLAKAAIYAIVPLISSGVNGVSSM